MCIPAHFMLCLGVPVVKFWNMFMMGADPHWSFSLGCPEHPQLHYWGKVFLPIELEIVYEELTMFVAYSTLSIALKLILMYTITIFFPSTDVI